MQESSIANPRTKKQKLLFVSIHLVGLSRVAFAKFPFQLSDALPDEEFLADLQGALPGGRGVQLEEVGQALPDSETFRVVPQNLVNSSGVGSVNLQKLVNVFRLLAVDERCKGVVLEVRTHLCHDEEVPVSDAVELPGDPVRVVAKAQVGVVLLLSQLSVDEVGFKDTVSQNNDEHVASSLRAADGNLFR